MQEARRLAAAPHSEVILVNHSGAIGGATTLLLSLSRSFARRGLPCSIVCPEGPAAALNWGDDATVVVPPRIDGPTISWLGERLTPSTMCVVTIAPETAPLVPFMASRSPTALLCLGPRYIMAEWLVAAEIDAIRSALHDSPDCRLFIARWSEVHVRDASELFQVTPDRISWLPPSVERPEHRIRAGATRSDGVLVPGRFSAERREYVELAVQLAVVMGRPVTAVGSGPDHEWIASRLSTLSEPSTVHIDTGIHRWMAQHDVVVASGLTALEAALLGCAVVLPRAVPIGGGFAAVLSPENFDELHATNLVGWGTEAEADEIRRQVIAMSPDRRDQLAARVQRACHPDTARDAILSAMPGGLGTAVRVDERSLSALAALSLEVRYWLEQLEQVAVARDYHRERSERFEALAREHGLLGT